MNDPFQFLLHGPIFVRPSRPHVSSCIYHPENKMHMNKKKKKNKKKKNKNKNKSTNKTAKNKLTTRP